ncbi:hypothetical protein RJ640_015953 [Escallonia rubra]|uniref:Cation-transporting P-type ATPase N-terminal domain-containing protein n=1 Tax=Escallonia rubra TaxID=112253 RepID=A0AA88UHN2_9ASTE|nr:hypothetical protein RJ640_015953 [Escallonia rubra]
MMTTTVRMMTSTMSKIGNKRCRISNRVGIKSKTSKGFAMNKLMAKKGESDTGEFSEGGEEEEEWVVEEKAVAIVALNTKLNYVVGREVDILINAGIGICYTRENPQLEEVFAHLKCSKQGLSSDEVQERLELFGYNKLEEK